MSWVIRGSKILTHFYSQTAVGIIKQYYITFYRITNIDVLCLTIYYIFYGG